MPPVSVELYISMMGMPVFLLKGDICRPTTDPMMTISAAELG
jgi:hypothetical protein